MEGDKTLLNVVYTALQAGNFVTALHWLEKFSQFSKLDLPDHSTPLHYACRHGRVDVVQRLITNCRCSLESKDAQGCSPLHTAAQYGQLEMLKYLLHGLFGPKVSSLLVKLTPGGKLSHSLTSFFEQKLWERHRDLSGNTPLHTACVHCQLAIVRLLACEIGCNPNHNNSDGLSCLHLAAQHGHLPLVKCLVEEVGIVTLEDRYGRLPYLADCLHFAAQHGHFPLVRYLVDDVGIDVMLECEVTSMHHKTPAYLAAEGGHLDILKYLVEKKGVDPCVKTSWWVISAEFSMPAGRSLVHIASLEGHLHVHGQVPRRARL